MNGAWLMELSDGEEMVVERGVSSLRSVDPRDRVLEAQRQAIQAFDEAADAEAGR